MEESIVEAAPKPNPLTTVTPFSKALALILFITLPFVGFYLGMNYQNLLTPSSRSSISIVPPETLQTKTSFSNLNNQSTPTTTNDTTPKMGRTRIFRL